MQIFIPTYGRADQQHTLKHLPKSIRERTTLVIQDCEKHLYQQYGQQKLVLPKHITTIAPTRQFIIDYANKNKMEKIVMLDDDLRFDARRMDDNGKFLVATEKQIEQLFKKIEKALVAHVHVGVLAREGGNRVTEPFRTCTRMMRVLAYRPEILKREKIRFDRLPLQEDFDVTLQLLKKGFPNYVICDFVQGQGTSGARGGCSHFRTIEMQNANSHALAKLHAPFVKVVAKETKGAWQGHTRIDVMVQWKKAFESSKR